MTVYLWRRGRGEKWAGTAGSARYGCSIAQLVMGLAAIMGWDVPDRRDERAIASFVRAHRKSVQRWLDWLALAGLIDHAPERDDEGKWWRTVITLNPTPALSHGALADAAERRAGWWVREVHRRRRGRKRDLTAILRHARLSRTQRRARAVRRRQTLSRHATRRRVRQIVQEALGGHLTHPFGASAPPQVRNHLETSEDDGDRGNARVRASAWDVFRRTVTSTPATKQAPNGPHGLSTDAGKRDLRPTCCVSDPAGPASAHGARVGAPDAVRAAVYRDVAELRWYGKQTVEGVERRLAVMARADSRWEPLVRRQRQRLAELAAWPGDAPRRWRLLEAWAVAAHGPQMACAGGFRLAFWSENRPNHGPRLDRALSRYACHADAARPHGWPTSPIAGLARWITENVTRQDGPTAGFAADVARFDRFTKQMAAYRAHRDPEHLEHAARRARRRQRLTAVAQEVNQRLSFRIAPSPTARLQLARELISSPHPGHQTAGRRLHAAAGRELRLRERDQRLVTGRHPGSTDAGDLAACLHAERWGLPHPGLAAMATRDLPANELADLSASLMDCKNVSLLADKSAGRSANKSAE